MMWQPIETAPKDGTEFLAYDIRTRKMDVCEMVYCGGDIFVPRPVQADGEYGPCTDEFGCNGADIRFWMPLPPPPEAE